MDPKIAERNYYNWALDGRGSIKLSVQFFSDVPARNAEMILSRFTSRYQPWGILNGWDIVIPVNRIILLAWLDQVKWIEQGPRPLMTWAGDFCFDPEGRYMYLSSGNIIGASIYRVGLPLSPSSTFEKLHTINEESICGIAFNREGQFFFTNWRHGRGNIYRMDLLTGKRQIVYSFKDRFIWDVSFR